MKEGTRAKTLLQKRYSPRPPLPKPPIGDRASCLTRTSVAMNLLSWFFVAARPSWKFLGRGAGSDFLQERPSPEF
jgi:hypothetical protein